MRVSLVKINAYNGKYYNKVYNYSTEEFDIEKKQSDEYNVTKQVTMHKKHERRKKKRIRT